jgi:tRNA A-37 threonylcarbamoyl transferase component Bud32
LKTQIAGFESRTEGNMLLLSRGPLAELMVARPVSDLLSRGEGAVEGRRSHTVLNLPGGGRAVVRHYIHGGVLRGITGDRFAGSERFFEEIRASEHLRAQGVNTPEVLGLLVQAGRLGFRRGALVTRMLEGGIDLLGYLKSETGRKQIADPSVKRAIIGAAARQVRRMHDAGVFHADLHIKNLLVSPDGGVWILDLDRARLMKRLGSSRRLSNLIRLGRSLEKTGLDSLLTGRDTYTFFLEYLKAGPPLEIDPRATVRKYRRHVARHRLFWKLGIR